MSAKKRQTFNKINRERELREKRERKAEKKELKKLAALEGEGEGTDATTDDAVAIETPAEQ